MDEPEQNPIEPIQIEHEQIMDGLGEVASAEKPAPTEDVQAIPLDDLTKGVGDAKEMDSLGEVVAREKPPQEKVEANAVQRANERRERLGLPPRVQAAQADHGREFVELGKVAREEIREDDAAAQPLVVPPEEMERLAFPGAEEPNAASDNLQNFMDGDKEWRAQVAMTLGAFGDTLRYFAREIEGIRQLHERSRG